MPEPSPYRRVLALVRLDASDTRIVQKALLLARMNRAELDLLHLVEPDGALDGGYSGASVEATAAALETAARRRLEFLAAGLGAAEARCHARYGPCRRTFLRHIEASPPDLVVTGSATVCPAGAYDVLILASSSTGGGRRVLEFLGAMSSRLSAFGV